MSQPTTYTLPTPDETVTAVKDDGGEVWHRDVDEDLDVWFANVPGGVERTWGDLLAESGPLTDVTAEEGL